MVRLTRSVVHLCGVWGILVAVFAVSPVLQANEQRRGDTVDPGRNYVLRPFDKATLHIFQEPDLSQTIRIDADGTVLLPLIGKVKIGGMTLEAAQNFLFELYDRDFLVNPQISLLVTEYSSRQVQVLGQVNSPGPVMIPVDRDLTLVEAIAASNGQTRLANLRRVVVRRVLPDGSTQTHELDVEQMITDDRVPDFILRDQDTVLVRERVF